MGMLLMLMMVVTLVFKNYNKYLMFFCVLLIFILSYKFSSAQANNQNPYSFLSDDSYDPRNVENSFIGSLLMIQTPPSIPQSDEGSNPVMENTNQIDLNDLNTETDSRFDDEIINYHQGSFEQLMQNINDGTNQMYAIALETRRNQLNTYINNQLFRELLFPSSTARAVGKFLQNVFGIDKGKGLTYDGTPHLFSLGYPEESRRWYCEPYLDDTNYFIPGSTDFYSGVFSPEVLFIYGLSKDYSNYPDLVDKNGNPLGYLYTFSWYISHPLTQEEFEQLSSSEKNQMGLDINTGEIELAIGVKASNGREHFSSSNKLKPGESSSVTRSVYLNLKLETIFFQFRGNYNLNGNQFYPPQKNCNSNNIGCIKSFEEGLENYNNYPTGSFVVITEDEDGNTYARGIPVGGLPSGSSSSNNDDSIFGNIWG
jgi:hypothetical protein